MKAFIELEVLALLSGSRRSARRFAVIEGVLDSLLEGHLPPSLTRLLEGGFAENRTCLG